MGKSPSLIARSENGIREILKGLDYGSKATVFLLVFFVGVIRELVIRMSNLKWLVVDTK